MLPDVIMERLWILAIGMVLMQYSENNKCSNYQKNIQKQNKHPVDTILVREK